MHANVFIDSRSPVSFVQARERGCGDGVQRDWACVQIPEAVLLSGPCICCHIGQLVPRVAYMSSDPHNQSRRCPSAKSIKKVNQNVLMFFLFHSRLKVPSPPARDGVKNGHTVSVERK
eukprot:1365563-Rhodomonas_salina.2